MAKNVTNRLLYCKEFRTQHCSLTWEAQGCASRSWSFTPSTDGSTSPMRWNPFNAPCISFGLLLASAGWVPNSFLYEILTSNANHGYLDVKAIWFTFIFFKTNRHIYIHIYIHICIHTYIYIYIFSIHTIIIYVVWYDITGIHLIYIWVRTMWVSQISHGVFLNGPRTPKAKTAKKLSKPRHSALWNIPNGSNPTWLGTPKLSMFPSFNLIFCFLVCEFQWVIFP